MKKPSLCSMALVVVSILFAPALLPAGEHVDASRRVTVRALTQGPRFHWFGYYDKLQFDPTGRFVLGMAVDFQHRSPRADDVIEIGMIDLADGDRWIRLGESRAWGWQQGCMLQWRPGSKSEVLWNDREGDRFVCRLLDVFTRAQRTVPYPIYSVSPDGRTAVTPDFRRIQDTRPGYGYAGLADPSGDEQMPAASGIWRVDLETGQAELAVTLKDIAALPHDRGAPGELAASKHWFNHLLFNPDGSRFIFLHRWRPLNPAAYKNVGNFGTRMLTARPDGTDVRIVDPYGKTSHFIWRDPEHILAWAWHPTHKSRFYLYEDSTERVTGVGLERMTRNGHCSYLPDTAWILNDTYPQGAQRHQVLYLYHVPTDRRYDLGRFASPSDYRGEWRCDLHPRFSPDGRWVTIDSTHGGQGRQIYLVDVGSVVDSHASAGR
jgi:hypothetical protein